MNNTPEPVKRMVYTSLELSKYLAEKMPFESEMVWRNKKIHTCPRDYECWYMGVSKSCSYRTDVVLELRGYKKNDEDISALTFVDLLHYLKLYGERAGWGDLCVDCYLDMKEGVELNKYCKTGMHRENDRSVYEHSYHKLLDNFIADNLTIGTHVEEFIRAVIE